MKFKETSYFKDQKNACRHFKRKSTIGYFISAAAFVGGLAGLLKNLKRDGYQDGVSDALDDVDRVIYNVEHEENEDSEEL